VLQIAQAQTSGLATIPEEDEDEGDSSEDNQYADGGETDKSDPSPDTPQNHNNGEHVDSNNNGVTSVAGDRAVVEAPPYETMYAACQNKDNNAPTWSNNWSSPSPFPTVSPFGSSGAASGGRYWHTAVPEPSFYSTAGYGRGMDQLLVYGVDGAELDRLGYRSGTASFEQQMMMIEQLKAARRYRARQSSYGYVNPRESVLGFDLEAHSPNGHDQPYVRVEDPVHESMKQYRRRYGY